MSEQCEGRYPVPQTSPPRKEAEQITYRCGKPAGHSGEHGPRDAPETSKLRLYSDTTMQRAEAILDFIESDFGQSGRDVRLEALRCEIDAAYRRGLRTAVETLTANVDPRCPVRVQFADGKTMRCIDPRGHAGGCQHWDEQV